jgi:hypothetical protein
MTALLNARILYGKDHPTESEAKKPADQRKPPPVKLWYLTVSDQLKAAGMEPDEDVEESEAKQQQDFADHVFDSGAEDSDADLGPQRTTLLAAARDALDHDFRSTGTHTPQVLKGGNAQKCAVCRESRKGRVKDADGALLGEDESEKRARLLKVRRGGSAGNLLSNAMPGGDKKSRIQCKECAEYFKIHVWLCIGKFGEEDSYRDSCWTVWHGVQDITSLKAKITRPVPKRKAAEMDDE